MGRLRNNGLPQLEWKSRELRKMIGTKIETDEEKKITERSRLTTQIKLMTSLVDCQLNNQWKFVIWQLGNTIESTFGPKPTFENCIENTSFKAQEG